jgi:hypothetical protein
LALSRRVNGSFNHRSSGPPWRGRSERHGAVHMPDRLKENSHTFVDPESALCQDDSPTRRASPPVDTSPSLNAPHTRQTPRRETTAYDTMTSIAPRVLARLFSWHSSTTSCTPSSTRTDQSDSLGVMKTNTIGCDIKTNSLHRVSSTNINIPFKKCASERLAPRIRRRSSRRYIRTGDSNVNDKSQATSVHIDREPRCERSDAPTTLPTFVAAPAAAWRKQQRECTNCGQIAFRSMSDDDQRLGAYCSLDCKTSHGYMASVHAAMDAQLSSLVDTWVDNGSSCSESSAASRPSSYASAKAGSDVESE